MWLCMVKVLTLPLWPRAAGMNWYCRCVTLSLGEGAAMKACMLPFNSIQGMRSPLEHLLTWLMAVMSPLASRSRRICCIQMVPAQHTKRNDKGFCEFSHST